MIVRIADSEIADLERQGKLIRCIAVVCRVCGFRQHASASSFLSDHERCPKGCTLTVQLGECRLCGDPIDSTRPKAVCMTHRGRNYHLFGNGYYATAIAETHWHAAEGTGPVSQYAATS